MEKDFNIDDKAAEAVVNRIFEAMPMLGPAMEKYGINPKFMIRFQPVSQMCQKTREENNLTIKQASLRLKVPQYRLKDIEAAGFEKIKLEILEKYIELLGMNDFFHGWVKKNKDIYQHIKDKKRGS